MYFKMALANVKKSFKDYGLYFLTLTFGVCIFYSFNTIGDQQVMREITQQASASLQMLQQVLSIVSVFVSIILASLLIYGNNFLIKKRKKELGLYRILGMSKNKVAHILFLETLCIGVLALGTGLIVGIGMGQGLSLLTIKLFDSELSNYQFHISVPALGKTILYFSIMFSIIMLFNRRIVSKYKIIDLLQASKRTEIQKKIHPFRALVLWLISIVMLVGAYVIILKTGLEPRDKGFYEAIALGVVGTYMYFASLTDCLIVLMERFKGIYFKDLNMFTVKQVQSKIYTHIASVTVICLMLFLTITGLSTGLSFKYTLEKGLEESTPYDASVIRYSADEEGLTIEETMKSIGFSFEEGDKYAIYNTYKSDVSMDQLFKDVPEQIGKRKIELVPISQFNANRVLKGEEPIELNQGCVLFTANQARLQKSIQGQRIGGQEVVLAGKKYSIQNEQVLHTALYTSGFLDNFGTLIVPDEVVANQKPEIETMNICYDKGHLDESERAFRTLFEGYRQGVYQGKKIDLNEVSFLVGSTTDEIYESNQSMTTITLFVGIYLSIVFLISSAALLALQQLSEASDSIEQYKTLVKIGVTKKMIKRSIFRQTIFYFALPLSLALVHSVVGIRVINTFLSAFNETQIGGAAFMTLMMLVVIYGGYFYTTYKGYINICKQAFTTSN